MNKFSILFTFIIIVFCIVAIQGNSKLKFKLYVASQCNASKKFITTQLYPTNKELGDYLDVAFVPWGKSNRSLDDNSVTCQFGPSDCAANRLQRCALSIMKQSDYVEYMNCEFATWAAVFGNYSCVTQVGLDAAEAKECVEGPEGDILEKIAEEDTNSVNLTYVPVISYNGLHGPLIQLAAKKNFKAFVCGLLKLQHENPDACNK